MSRHDIRLKRAYAPASADDGIRLLVDRMWPRGVSKQNIKTQAWLKDIAPSTELRQWFGHVPERWEEFRKRYARELDANPDAVALMRVSDLLEQFGKALLTPGGRNGKRSFGGHACSCGDVCRHR